MFFQFYDPIFRIIEEMSTEKKNFMIQKNRLNLRMAQKDRNMAQKIYQQVMNARVATDSDEEDKINRMNSTLNPINVNASMQLINY